MRHVFRLRWMQADTDPNARHWRGARWDDWEMVWNAVGAMRCPRCAALVETQVRYIHEDDHERQDAINYAVTEAIKVIAAKAGVVVRFDDDDEQEQTEAPGSYIFGDTDVPEIAL